MTQVKEHKIELMKLRRVEQNKRYNVNVNFPGYLPAIYS